MSQVGEFERRDVGQDGPATGFLAGAASLLGLGRLFRPVARVSDFLPAEGPVQRSLRPTPIFRPIDPPVAAGVASAAQIPETQGSATDEIERLASHIAGKGPVDRARRVLITHGALAETPLAGLDCAAFSSQLARALSTEGRTILVIFGAGGGVRPGMSELIDGSASFSEAIHREAGSRLHILPSGRGRAAPCGGLNVVLDALSDTYDYVVLSASDEDAEGLRRLTIALASRVDHVLIGCAGQAGSPDMVAYRDALKDEGAGEVIAVRMGATPVASREAA
jgi:hypothetical protein